MTISIKVPRFGIQGEARYCTKAMVRHSSRLVAIALTALIALAASPIAMSSKALADRSWSLGSTVSQTYKKQNWSGGPKLGQPAKKNSYTTKNKSKKKRLNRTVKKNHKIYRKNRKTKKKNKKSVKVAAVDLRYVDLPKNTKSVAASKTGGNVRWVASSSCLNARLKSIIYEVASKFGRVTVNSTCRSKKHNRRVGGAKRSKHLTGNAVDFRIHGKYGAAYAFLKKRSGVGGYKHYGGGLFHIDTGPRRTW